MGLLIFLLIAAGFGYYLWRIDPNRKSTNRQEIVKKWNVKNGDKIIAGQEIGEITEFKKNLSDKELLNRPTLRKVIAERDGYIEIIVEAASENWITHFPSGWKLYNIYDEELIKREYENTNLTVKTNPSFSDEKCYVYLMHDTSNNFYKIGISNKPVYRERTLQSEKPTIDLIIAKEFPSRIIAKSFEKALHESFQDKRLRGEWFELSETEVSQLIKSLD